MTEINTANTCNKIIKKQKYQDNQEFFQAIPANPSMCIGKNVILTQ